MTREEWQRRLLEGTPRPAENRLATFEAPEALAEQNAALGSCNGV